MYMAQLARVYMDDPRQYLGHAWNLGTWTPCPWSWALNIVAWTWASHLGSDWVVGDLRITV